MTADSVFVIVKLNLSRIFTQEFDVDFVPRHTIRRPGVSEEGGDNPGIFGRHHIDFIVPVTVLASRTVFGAVKLVRGGTCDR
ncbi:hypothetical protein D3C71_2011280 [compost metagenome]